MSGSKDLDNAYLFKHVSLLSTSDVRYDGILYIIDYDANTLALQHVRCMGTEGRRTGEQAIAPSDSTYEFIIFRADNIKKVYVVEDNRYADITGEILEPLRSKPSYNPSSSYTGHPQSYSPYTSPPLPSGSGPRVSRNGVSNHVEEDEEEIPMGYPSMVGNSHGSRKMHGEQMPLEDDMYVSSYRYGGGHGHNDEHVPKRRVGVQGQKYGSSMASGGDRIEPGRRSYNYPNPESRSYNYEQPRGFRPPIGPRPNVHVDYRNDNRYDYRAPNNAYSHDDYSRRPQNIGRGGGPGGMRRDYYGSQPQTRPSRNYNPNYYPRVPPPQQYGNNTYRAPIQPRTGGGRAGTGEFLEHRKLAGNEIEIPKEDLPLEKLTLNVEQKDEQKDKKENEPGKTNPEKTQTTETSENKDAGTEASTTANEKQEESSKDKSKSQDTVTLTHGKIAYDKANFFDDLNLDSNKEKGGDERVKSKRFVPVNVQPEDQEDQRHLDAETFGSVAEQYRFASGIRRGTSGPRYNRGGYNNNANYYQSNAQPRYGNRANYNNNNNYNNYNNNNRYQEKQPQFQRPAWQPRQ